MLHSGRKRLYSRGLNSLNSILTRNAGLVGSKTTIPKILGQRTILTSFHEPIGAIKRKDKKTWQPEENIDIQRVTQTAIVSSKTMLKPTIAKT